MKNTLVTDTSVIFVMSIKLSWINQIEVKISQPYNVIIA